MPSCSWQWEENLTSTSAAFRFTERRQRTMASGLRDTSVRDGISCISRQLPCRSGPEICCRRRHAGTPEMPCRVSHTPWADFSHSGPAGFRAEVTSSRPPWYRSTLPTCVAFPSAVPAAMCAGVARCPHRYPVVKPPNVHEGGPRSCPSSPDLRRRFSSSSLRRSAVSLRRCLA